MTRSYQVFIKYAIRQNLDQFLWIWLTSTYWIWRSLISRQERGQQIIYIKRTIFTSFDIIDMNANLKSWIEASSTYLSNLSTWLFQPFLIPSTLILLKYNFTQFYWISYEKFYIWIIQYTDVCTSEEESEIFVDTWLRFYYFIDQCCNLIGY